METDNLNQHVLQLNPTDRALIKIIEQGLPLVRRPYADIAKQLNINEQDVISRLQYLMDNGAIKRYGIVVRHRKLGYTANGMVVWNIPDARIDELGTCIGKYSCVTLSYKRPRRLPNWPYNLFTMVHGKDKIQVRKKVEEIVIKCKLQSIDYNILFSSRCFKQRGASYGLKNQDKAQVNLRLVK